MSQNSNSLSLLAAPPLVGACGRADLLIALSTVQNNVTHEITNKEIELADILGFSPIPDEQKSDDDISDKPVRPLTLSIPITIITTDPANVFHPYHLVAIDSVQSNEEWQTQGRQSKETGKLTHADMDAWDAHYPVPKAMPIVPWTRLWPRLRQAVACRHTGGIDFQRLTDCVARGIAVRQLPRLTRLAWPSPLTVVLDFSERLTPYWDDWHWLRKNLQNGLHQQAQFYRLQGVPQRQLQRLINGKPEAKFVDWPVLTAGSTLLLASDLGMVDAAHPWPRACWQSKLNDYKSQGVQVVVLAPVSARHLQPTLVNAANIVRVSPDSSLRPLARMRTDDDSVSVHKPENYSGSDTLLAMLSVATKVETALLRDLRRCLPDDSQDAGIEGEVWCHKHLDTSALACAVSPYAVKTWRDEFQQLPEALQQRTLDCLRNWHAQLPQAIHHEETLLWCYLTQNQDNTNETAHIDKARDFFVRVTNSLKDKPMFVTNSATRDLQIQLAGRHLQWVSPVLANQESYIGDLSVAVTQADPERSALGLSEGINPLAWLKSLPIQTPENLTLVQYPDLSIFLTPDFTPETAALGITPLADMELDRPGVLLSLDKSGTTPNYRPCYWPSELSFPRLPPLVTLSAETQNTHPDLFIFNGRHQLRFKPLSKPAWASEFGQDNYGLYADLEYKTTTQRFRWINPGTFLMGSPENEPERWNEMELQHQVTLSQGYWLADSACTQALWIVVMGENPSDFKDDVNNPVETVSWNDAQQFIQRLNESFPDLYARLPTEAEWEYACRAGTVTPFSFGDNITPDQVNYDGNNPYTNGAKGEYREKTVPVKSLPENPWGLYEMHGNVWEWCEDWHGEYDVSVTTDPTGAPDGSYRVLRGGSWIDNARLARSADRRWYIPDYRFNRIGFRLALGRKGVSQEGQGVGKRRPDGLRQAERGDNNTGSQASAWEP